MSHPSFLWIAILLIVGAIFSARIKSLPVVRSVV